MPNLTRVPAFVNDSIINPLEKISMIFLLPHIKINFINSILIFKIKLCKHFWLI